jgi:secretion/DNA translocation related TadE-like protein
MRNRNNEIGSGTVLVIIAISIVLATTAAVAALASGYQARHGAAAAADLAALAGAERLRTGGADPCATARRVSDANGASLVDCTVHDWTVEVTVHRDIDTQSWLGSDWLGDPIRRARAGVDPPAAPLPEPAGPTGWVLPVPPHTRVTAVFGQPGPHWASGRHTGVDFAAPIGTPAVASAGGTVTVAGTSGPYGKLVVVDHGGMATYYAHLSSIAVTTGDVVAAGSRIGAVGATGNVTGPHLHFELRIGGVPHDPMTVLGD